MPRTKVLKLSPAKIARFHVDKAIKEGRLHRLCQGSYEDGYVAENFCPGCSFNNICEAEQKAMNSSGEGRKSETTCP